MYFDNNASTALDPEIFDIFQSISNKTKVSNPHSMEHAYGWGAAEIIEESKEIIAQFINCLPEEVYFTSGATESNNWAIIGASLAAKKAGNKRNEIIVSAVEHKCVLNAAHYLSDFHGFIVKEAPVNENGILDLQGLEKMLEDTTLIVSVMAANNEIGTEQPLSRIGQLCRHAGAIFHVDGAQGAYSNIDVIEKNIDMLSLSGHKIYAPKGIGVLFISEDLKPKPVPLMHGGSQQNGLRAGTLSPALCRSMAKAFELLERNISSEIDHLKSLRARFLDLLKENGINYSINGDMKHRHPGNLNVQFKNIDANMLITRLQPNIAISTGSACNAGVIQSSYVLTAIGLTQKEIDSSVRIGFGRFNTKEEVSEAVAYIAKTIKDMTKSDTMLPQRIFA